MKFGFVVLCTLFCATSVGASDCALSRVDIRGAGGLVRFNVEIADDAGERALGLMNRATMPKSSGMLFVYDRPQAVAFWMKNTLIPLDMIFAGPDGRVRRVHSNAVPHDLTPIDGGDGIFAVLEINGGLSGALGITEGAVIRHPAFAQDKAIWSCEKE
ncbi:DUF192 domain-containing protein [Pseudogemmobacter sp. W21_MBD1_M6]|uniref:DUF192 domain-containing protein n=1 Tax=Pseudogemmobacter sp. W21_MBD1_M6 TaxID=3240271 RepID=UPI003F99EA24